MINVPTKLIEAMKSEKGAKRDATLAILGDLKTKMKDFHEINPEVQNKLLKKMKGDREKALQIFSQNNRADLAEKESSQLDAINLLLSELEEYLPKQMGEEEIQSHLNDLKSKNEKLDMRIVMEHFKNLQADKATVSKMARSMF